MSTTKRWIWLAAFALVCTACSASTTGISLDPVDTGAEATLERTTDDSPTSAESVTDPETNSAPRPTAAPTSTPTPTPEPLIEGATGIRSTTAVDGGGVTPTFSWEALDDAATYFLVVRDDAGVPYWSWSGTEAEVRMPHGGPTVADGYSWSVSAFGADGRFVAISPAVDIAP